MIGKEEIKYSRLKNEEKTSKRSLPINKQIIAIGVIGAIAFVALPVITVGIPIAAIGAVCAITLFLVIQPVLKLIQGIQ